MISRVTVWSLLLAMVIPSGMWLWVSGHRDSCSRYLAGDKTQSPSQMVAVGSEMVEVPCEQWLVRQPVGLQAVWLVEVLVVLVFGIHVAGDVREWMRRRRGRVVL